MQPSPPNSSHCYLEDENASSKKTKNKLLKAPKVNGDGLFTNRLLWLGASAGAVPLWVSGCRNLALWVFMNKP